jgi:hypothetical protein
MMDKKTLQVLREKLLDPKLPPAQWAAGLIVFTEITDGIQGKTRPPADDSKIDDSKIKDVLRQAVNVWTDEGHTPESFIDEIVPRLK